MIIFIGDIVKKLIKLMLLLMKDICFTKGKKSLINYIFVRRLNPSQLFWWVKKGIFIFKLYLKKNYGLNNNNKQISLKKV